MTVDLDLLIDQGSIWSPFLSAEDEPFMRCKLQIDAVRPFAAPIHCRALWLHLDPDWPVQNWPDITGRSVTDWLEVWRIDQKLQTWHGKHRPEGIDQKCEELTRSMSLKHDWSEVISSVKKCCEGLTRSVKDWPEVCVWNMIDQKCEGLTRIDQKYVFETCLHSLYSAWDVFVVCDGALLCVFFLHMPQKLPWPSGLGAPERYATSRV